MRSSSSSKPVYRPTSGASLSELYRGSLKALVKEARESLPPLVVPAPPSIPKPEAPKEIPPQDRPATIAARDSLAEFIRQAWPIVDPKPLVWGWHLDAMAQHLEALFDGEINKLLINIGPGYAKSLVVSVLFPAWCWTQNPAFQSVWGSYADNLSVRDSVRCRRVIESEWYQENFSGPAGWELARDQNAKDYYQNTKNGHRYATSVGGGGTGYRGDLVGIDDPLKALDAHSRAKRLEHIRWFSETMSSRFNEAKEKKFVVIMQRLHEEDLSGHLLSDGGWEHLRLPSEFEADERAITYHFVNGEKRELWRDPREKEGDLLFPEKFGAAELAEAKKEMRADGYAGQHQQRPNPATGNMFKKEWWRFWKPDGVSAEESARSVQLMRPKGCYMGPARALPTMDRLVISVDASFKETESGSFVAIHVWGKRGPDRFLLDRYSRRMDFFDTCQQLSTMIRKWPRALEKLIEEKANGPAIISQLSRRWAGFIAINPEGGKEARAFASQPYVRGGNTYLPDGAEFLDEYIAQHAAFPKGKWNDDVDAQSQALIFLDTDETTADLWARST